MLAPKNVAIVLHSDGVSGAVVAGRRIVRSESVSLDQRRWREAWEGGLIECDAPLAEVLRRLHAGSSPRVRVLTRSPTCVLDVCSVAGHGAAALHAARLRLLERFEDGDRPTVAAAVGASDDHEGQARTHVLAAADTDLATQTLYAWVARAGGRMAAYVPRAAVPLTEAFRLASLTPDQSGVWCFIDRASTALVAVDRGELQFVRSIEVGYQPLIEAYARGLLHEDGAVRTREDDPPLDMDGALLQLFEHGVPGRGAPISQTSNPHRLTIGPLLAPVVQRLCVEIKQTVRYGSLDPERRPRTLHLAGPGGAVPGIADLLCQSTELDVAVHDPEASAAPFGPGSAERLFAIDGTPPLFLLPHTAVQRRAAAVRASALRAGAVLAVGLLATESGLITMQRRAVAADLQEIARELNQTRSALERREEAAALAERLNLAAYVTERLAGPQVDWRVTLSEIAAICGSSVTIDELRAFTDAGVPTLVLSGLAIDAPGARQGEALGAFIGALSGSPLIERVELGSTNADRDLGQGARRFTVRCVLRGLPLPADRPELYAGTAPPPPKGRKP